MRDEKPVLWRQLPVATKLYFAILLGLVVLIGLLILIRVDFFTFQWLQWELPSVRDWLPLRKILGLQIPTPLPDAPRLVSQSDIEVYDGPGVLFQNIGMLPEGTEAGLLGLSVDGQWWAIELIDTGEIGWVPVGMVTVQNEAALPVLDTLGKPVLATENETPSLTAISDAEIYFGPGTEYGLIGYLEVGQRSEVLGRDADGSWWVIRTPYFESGQGWVAADKVTAENILDVPIITPDAKQLAARTAETAGQIVTALANINIRSGPGIGYNKIGTLANGQQVEAVGVSADGFWLVVRAPDAPAGQGWVSIDYVAPQDVEGLPVVDLNVETGALVVPTPAENLPTATALTMVNIRNGPGLQYKVLGRLEPGQKVEIIGISPDKSWWLIKVAIEDKGRGWVAVNFVKAENTDGIPIIQ